MWDRVVFLVFYTAIAARSATALQHGPFTNGTVSATSLLTTLSTLSSTTPVTTRSSSSDSTVHGASSFSVSLPAGASKSSISSVSTASSSSRSTTSTSTLAHPAPGTTGHDVKPSSSSSLVVVVSKSTSFSSRSDSSLSSSTSTPEVVSPSTNVLVATSASVSTNDPPTKLPASSSSVSSLTKDFPSVATTASTASPTSTIDLEVPISSFSSFSASSISTHLPTTPLLPTAPIFSAISCLLSDLVSLPTTLILPTFPDLIPTNSLGETFALTGASPTTRVSIATPSSVSDPGFPLTTLFPLVPTPTTGSDTHALALPTSLSISLGISLSFPGTAPSELISLIHTGSTSVFSGTSVSGFVTSPSTALAMPTLVSTSSSVSRLVTASSTALTVPTTVPSGAFSNLAPTPATLNSTSSAMAVPFIISGLFASTETPTLTSGASIPIPTAYPLDAFNSALNGTQYVGTAPVGFETSRKPFSSATFLSGVSDAVSTGSTASGGKHGSKTSDASNAGVTASTASTALGKEHDTSIPQITAPKCIPDLHDPNKCANSANPTTSAPSSSTTTSSTNGHGGGKTGALPPISTPGIVGVAIASTSAAILAVVAGLLLARRQHNIRVATREANQVYPELAYLYDPPMPARIGSPDDPGAPGGAGATIVRKSVGSGDNFGSVGNCYSNNSNNGSNTNPFLTRYTPTLPSMHSEASSPCGSPPPEIAISPLYTGDGFGYASLTAEYQPSYAPLPGMYGQDEGLGLLSVPPCPAVPPRRYTPGSEAAMQYLPLAVENGWEEAQVGLPGGVGTGRLAEVQAERERRFRERRASEMGFADARIVNRQF